MKARIPGQNGQSQAAMMKQVQKMQADMTNLQAELEEREFTAQAGGGMVEVTMNGRHELKGCISTLPPLIRRMPKCLRTI